MSTYSAEWATKVYYAFVELCPRAQQMDSCILQTIAEQFADKLTKDDLSHTLIYCLRQKGTYRWNLYRKLIKSKTFSPALLERVSMEIWTAFWEIDVEKKQRQFAWD